MDEPTNNSTSDELAATLEAMIPKNLNDVVRKNKDQVQVRLAKENEISNLHTDIDAVNPVYILDNWSLIAIVLVKKDKSTIHLIGDIRGVNEPRITSHVISIDKVKKVLTTNSGNLYEMGTPQRGEPDQDKLYLICAYLHQWGIGRELGVPHFFY